MMSQKTTEHQKKQRAKNVALLIALMCVVALFYGLAVVRIKLGH
jgi:hypothetical protein